MGRTHYPEAAERHAILDFLENGVDLEDVLRRSVQLLAQVTKQAAVVQMPNLKVSRCLLYTSDAADDTINV